MDAEALALHAVPDDELVRRLSELVSHSRRVEADLVAHVGEVDARRLFARKAFPSMFAYCTEGLHLSEAEAYRRITVARGARRHPILLAMLRDGRLHLSGIVTLLPVLTVDNRDELLARATHRSKRQVEELVAAVSPRPDVPAGVRRIPERRGKPDRPSLNGERAGSATGRGELVPGRVETVQGGVQLFPDGVEPTNLGGPRSRPQAALIQPLAPGRYRVQFTASAELRDKLERLTALMRSEIPDVDLARVIEAAITEKLDRLETKRFGKTVSPRKPLSASPAPGSRRVPAAVRRAVAERDEGRCRFVDAQGRRCSERHGLEYHHRHPFAMGGGHDPANVSLLCSQHNRYLAERDFGAAAIGRHVKPG